ncbi:hypothetical protein [Comamonas odontotermitis]|uniref:hypothetical protein n=1 Tax=Comamonas odontotermitis TaxID=379895 RepID=UPI001CC5F183|nr:hypothetical protein [Comamonas odontotermitis]UBB15482.1 hypothetical protein LAD35_11405 [Comamonas odontotermitis]
MTDKTEAQPEALRLADLYTAENWPGDLSLNKWALSAATELRRQHAEIQQLKARVHELGQMHDHSNLVVDAAKERIATLEAQLSARQAVPNPWQQAIDHELVCLHHGVAGEATKESALKALQELIQCHVEIAINPQTNGGLSLQPHTEAQPVPKGWLPVWAVFRTRPDENGGKEFLHYAMWHDDTILSEGERYVQGYFVPGAAPPPPEREPLSQEQKYAVIQEWIMDRVQGAANAR